MHQAPPIVILQQVDSTNNYAMALINAQLATSGSACFAFEQTEGRGQRGKSWMGAAGQNIALSVVFDMRTQRPGSPFCFQAAMALAAHRFLHQYVQYGLTIKWPNDLYWNDRKAGGILIENKYSGNQWNWSVVGIGININQELFDPELPNPVSLFQITGIKYDPLKLARELYQHLMNMYDEISYTSEMQIIKNYNDVLYKRKENVQLRVHDAIFDTKIEGVSLNGCLLTKDLVDRSFQFGEVEWLIAD